MKSLLGLIALSALLTHAQTSPKVPKRKAPSKAVSPIQFVDVTKQAGIDFHLSCGSKEKLYIMDAMCGGIAFTDFDNDGWADIFLLNGSTLEAMKSGQHPPSKLYRNLRNGKFADVTVQFGLTLRGWGIGVATGDYNGDGFEDLYLTYLDHAVLYRNEGGKRFVDVTKESGVDNGGRWGTSAAWGDYDSDGDLDLYVANYVDIDLKNLPAFGSSTFCQYRGIKVSCGPRGLKGSRDRLYRNQGGGTFVDVAEQLQIDPEAFYGLGVIFLDYNNDGCQDIYISDDSSPSLLYRGDCTGRLEEVGVSAGVAFSSDGQEQAGMGVDAADYDADGDFDIAKINFSDDMNNLYRNEGGTEFTDVAGPSAFGPVSTPFLGFGVRFVDFDNDGWQDVFVANGHVNPQVDAHKFGVTYAERNLLFRNLGNGKFQELGERAGPAMRVRRVGRGAATADFDHDGRLDVLVSNLDGSPLLLRNTSPGSNNWLGVRITGGIGARVSAKIASRIQIREARSNHSYLSSSDPILHFGLGKVQSAGVEVRWPNGPKRNIQVTSNQVIAVAP